MQREQPLSHSIVFTTQTNRSNKEQLDTSATISQRHLPTKFWNSKVHSTTPQQVQEQTANKLTLRGVQTQTEALAFHWSDQGWISSASLILYRCFVGWHPTVLWPAPFASKCPSLLLPFTSNILFSSSPSSPSYTFLHLEHTILLSYRLLRYIVEQNQKNQKEKSD